MPMGLPGLARGKSRGRRTSRRTAGELAGAGTCAGRGKCRGRLQVRAPQVVARLLGRLVRPFTGPVRPYAAWWAQLCWLPRILPRARLTQLLPHEARVRQVALRRLRPAEDRPVRRGRSARLCFGGQAR